MGGGPKRTTIAERGALQSHIASFNPSPVPWTLRKRLLTQLSVDHHLRANVHTPTHTEAVSYPHNSCGPYRCNVERRLATKAHLAYRSTDVDTT